MRTLERLVRTKANGIRGVVISILFLATGCSSVSICLEQEKGVSASEDARAAYQACKRKPMR